MIAEIIVIGLLGGVVSGMLGVGGGVLFVPGLIFAVGLSQLDAEATSLVAIIPVAMLGAWRQHGYGNLRLGEGTLIGVLSVAGAVAGVALANVLAGFALRLLFALLMLAVACQLARRGRQLPTSP